MLVLFVFDHNVSSIMAQSKEFKLQKGSAYHLDFFVLGICIVVTGVLGILIVILLRDPVFESDTFASRAFEGSGIALRQHATCSPF